MQSPMMTQTQTQRKTRQASATQQVCSGQEEAYHYKLHCPEQNMHERGIVRVGTAAASQVTFKRRHWWRWGALPPTLSCPLAFLLPQCCLDALLDAQCHHGYSNRKSTRKDQCNNAFTEPKLINTDPKCQVAQDGHSSRAPQQIARPLEAVAAVGNQPASQSYDQVSLQQQKRRTWP
jgi:hypothetical protein